MNKRIACIFAFCLLAICLIFLFSCNKEEIVPASVDILKIGKADCIVINTGTKIVMIDTGEVENLDDIHFYMNKKGYTSIDTLILTHYDKDHIGGASDIISTYNVKEVVETKITDNSFEYLDYHNTMANQGISPKKLNESYSFEYDSCKFTIDIPQRDKYEEKQDNNSSLIVSMWCGDTSFLFCGDAMELRLREIIERNIGTYDFVKLPYHGNYLENYEDFLKMTKPQYSVITDSKKNTADEKTLDILKEFEVENYETRYGTVSITTDGSTIAIKQ
ncbi:MAG: MBL fold metallo-hydrolase [Clostridia bacterium]|nr:MBL fold metallo-hydrolase [Clostridia bacterium]